MKKAILLSLFLIFNLSLKAQENQFIPQTKKDGWPTTDHLKDHQGLYEMDSLIKANYYKKISSVVIAHKGEIVFENYYSGSQADSKHNTRSTTKTITGALIGSLIEDGLIKSEQEPALKYAAIKPLRYPDPRKAQITIEDLLTMSTILECDDWNQFSNGNEEKMYLIEDWAQFYWDLPIKGYPEWTTKPKDAKYGRSFSYCTAGVVALGDIINNITGSLEKYTDKTLFSALGITDYHWQMTPTNQAMTGGGLSLKSRDLLKISQLYLNQGIWQGKQIIPKSWILKSTTPKAAFEGDRPYEYGYLWWLADFAGENAYFMTGTGGNKVVVFPNLELTVVLTSTYYNGGLKAHDQTADLLKAYIVPAFKKS